MRALDFDILTRVRFPKIKTLDTSSTPARGEQRIEPKRLARVDIGRLYELLTAFWTETRPGRPGIVLMDRPTRSFAISAVIRFWG